MVSFDSHMLLRPFGSTVGRLFDERVKPFLESDHPWSSILISVNHHRQQRPKPTTVSKPADLGLDAFQVDRKLFVVVEAFQ